MHFLHVLSVVTSIVLRGRASSALQPILVYSLFNLKNVNNTNAQSYSVIVGGISGLLFTIIVMVASFITTFLMPAFNQPSEDTFYNRYYVSPTEVASDLIAAAFRVIRDGGIEDIPEEPSWFWSPKNPLEDHITPQASSGIVRRFIRRFVLGLPLVGAASLVQMLITAPLIGPVQWIARYRGSRRNRNSHDIAAVIVVSLLIMGALRYLFCSSPEYFWHPKSSGLFTKCTDSPRSWRNAFFSGLRMPYWK